MPRLRPLRALLLPVVAALALTLSACAPAEPVELSDSAVIIDVRTPAEYAEGALEGAINADVSSGAFDALIADLPTDGEYLVYCRSGNRSAQAADRMKAAGFTNVIDAGAIGAASTATGLPIVTP